MLLAWPERPEFDWPGGVTPVVLLAGPFVAVVFPEIIGEFAEFVMAGVVTALAFDSAVALFAA